MPGEGAICYVGKLVRLSLAALIQRHFGAEVRSRGASVYRSGAVSVSHASGSEINGFVAGTYNYFVSLEFFPGEGVLEAHCECPYFSDNREPCKHLWAMVLAADAKGKLEVLKRHGRPSLRLVPPDDGEEEIDEDDDDEEIEDYIPHPRGRIVEEPKAPPPPPAPRWKEQVMRLAQAHQDWAHVSADWPTGREISYVLNAKRSEGKRDFFVELMIREQMKRGGLGKPRPLQISRAAAARLTRTEDRELLSLMAGSPGVYSTDYDDRHGHISDVVRLSGPRAELLLPKLCATGRLYLQTHNYEDWTRLRWDEGAAWVFELDLADAGRVWRITGSLAREGERLPISAARAVCHGGFVVLGDRVARLDHGESFAAVAQMRGQPPLEALKDHFDDLVNTFASTPGLPRLVLPRGTEVEEVILAPAPCLELSKAWDRVRLKAALTFQYGDSRIAGGSPGRGVYDADSRKLMLRDLEFERKARQRLLEAGLREESSPYPPYERYLLLSEAKLPAVVRELVKDNWRIEAEGKVFRRAGKFKLDVSSGIDWFELRGTADFEGASARLPELLKALQRGDKMVLLDDGSLGMLPEEWLAEIRPLVGMGQLDGDHVRFGKNQAGVLDVLLADREDVDWDEGFERIRTQLSQFQGVKAAPQPEGFTGSLRVYQREGLGWMEFLRTFGFGGCLADDMGVGKTAQVLALLETRRELREQGKAGPSLAVVPKSLVFNWRQEAARFTPKLRVLDYTGLGRDASKLEQSDLILTTYGTLRRDVVGLRNMKFDYVILDEAQAIKNASSESAKAARLLEAGNRLALSGTPVENHLGELWSLFEFLNPGMLGSASVFRGAAGLMRNADEEVRRVLARALRPFILRRTKQQVASELPPKTEQTLYCELEAPQRKLYDELRAHYRSSLLGRIEKNGLARSKMYVLEALLRLRQAACHPGLVDPKRTGEASAKLDMLLPQIEEVVDEGHKVLVFSQFVSFLDIVRTRLDEDGVTYEYLDGKTRDRQERVERFQNDPDCKLFLISLKAGGVGLNLTAADYVFLLDPWWNPAVEAQAIDRTHRIGQSRQVFAYRLIAKDTVEEKVLALQSTKRDLADAIINEDNSLIRDLGRNELEMLLS